jgi:hypothetical protein
LHGGGIVTAQGYGNCALKKDKQKDFCGELVKRSARNEENR